MFPKIALIALFIGAIVLPARSQLGLPLLGGLGSGSAACGANAAQVNCGLLDVSLQCEQQCNDTAVCVNVCTNLLNTVSGLLGSLPLPLPALTTCICQDGFYRNDAGACVTLDLCAHTGVNLKKRQSLLPSLPLPLPSLPLPTLPSLGSGSAACAANEAVVSCGLLDVSLQCEQQCNATAVCVNVCTNLINTVTSVLGSVTSLLSILPIPVPLPSLPALTTCICQDGFYRNDAGACVTLDLCAQTGVNLKKRQTLSGSGSGSGSASASLPSVPSVPALPLPIPTLPSLPLPTLPSLGSGSAACAANEAVVSCGLLDVSLQCEQQCNATAVCVNVCTNLINTVTSVLSTVTGLLSILPVPVPLPSLPALTTCICQDGFYRNDAGACVTLDLCAQTGVNL